MSEPLQTLGDDPPPGQQHRFWPPISSTLIAGEDSAVLVDTPITTAQASVLADWVAAKGKNLTDIYITHGHPDHWFGVSVLLDRFPTARVVAMPAVIRQMRRYITPDALPLWQQRFPGQVPDRPRRRRRASLHGDRLGRPGTGGHGTRSHGHGRHPDRAFPGALWASASELKSG